MFPSSRSIAFAALAVLAIPAAAQEAATIDWSVAEAAFQEERANGVEMRRGRAASTCVAYWQEHLYAHRRGDYPPEALELFDPELADPGEAELNALVYSTAMSSNPHAYRNAQDAAKRRMTKLLAGDAKELRTFFHKLGECSFGE